MANRLIVEFTDAVREHPVAYGRKVRTEVLDIPGSTEGFSTTLAATAGNNIVSCYAEAPCWIAIGADPDPEDGTQRRFMPAGLMRDFWIDAGEHVAVVPD